MLARVSYRRPHDPEVLSSLRACPGIYSVISASDDAPDLPLPAAAARGRGLVEEAPTSRKCRVLVVGLDEARGCEPSRPCDGWFFELGVRVCSVWREALLKGGLGCSDETVERFAPYFLVAGESATDA